MRKNLMAMTLAACAVMGIGMVASGDDYAIDPVHSGITFQIRHADVSWIPGRFNQFSGEFTLDKEAPAKSSFTLTVSADSVDTNNAARDRHLKSPDFFNANQFPKITFKSTSVKAVPGGYQVTGDFTMHGEKKAITFTLKGGREAEFPKGTRRTGFSTELTLKRSDFGMNKFTQAISDEIHVSISFEGTKK